MRSRYLNTEIDKSSEGRQYKRNVIYPEIPLSEDDDYIIAQAGDRYDLLARDFYNDQSLWWIIASLDTTFNGSLNVKPGVQLRIPNNKESILLLYEELNRNR